MRDAELLSLLLDGALPPDQADALRARINAEPELAALWDAMSGLPGALGALPLETPPPELDRRVLAPVESEHRRWPGWMGWAVAAGFVIALVWPRPAAEYVLLEGQQEVTGPARVSLADERWVQVDGHALIVVEPSPWAVREAGSKEGDMNAKLLLPAAAAAGAALTVVVYEGQALIHGGDSDVTVVEAGETHTDQPRTPSPERRVVVRQGDPQDGAQDLTLPEALERIEALEQALLQESFEGQLKDGRIVSHEGVPQAFPDDLDPSYAPNAYEAALLQAIEDNGEGELVSLDCSEFPCLATLTIDGHDDNWSDALQPIAESLVQGEGDGLNIWASGFRTDEGQHNYWSFAITPELYQDDDALDQRTEYRMMAVVDDLAADVEDAAHDEDADVIIE